MKPARVALSGILLLLAGVLSIAYATGQRRPNGPSYPDLLNVQTPSGTSEFEGLVEYRSRNCQPIVSRLQTVMSVDNFFPITYFLGLLGILYFIAAPAAPGLPAQPAAAKVFAMLSAFALILTVICDYNENAHTNPILATACTMPPSWGAIVAMRSASFEKWGALGLSLLLLGIASLSTRRTAAWYFSFTSIRSLAAIGGGLSGIAALWVQQTRLAQIELTGVTLVVLATLWQTVADW